MAEAKQVVLDLRAGNWQLQPARVNLAVIIQIKVFIKTLQYLKKKIN